MKKLLIFDCDGVLVDSEMIVTRHFVSQLKDIGFEITEEESLKRYLGKSVPTIYEKIYQESGISISQEVIERIQKTIQLALTREVQAIAEISNFLSAIESNFNVSYCVASSGSFERINNSLNTAKLMHYFKTEHIFSAQQVHLGKPAPDLFLYAAKNMGFEPNQCVVIEDSPAGIEAAKAAQMSVIGFTAGSHTQFSWYLDRLKGYEIPIVKNVKELREHLKILFEVKPSNPG